MSFTFKIVEQRKYYTQNSRVKTRSTIMVHVNMQTNENGGETVYSHYVVYRV